MRQTKFGRMTIGGGGGGGDAQVASTEKFYLLVVGGNEVDGIPCVMTTPYVSGGPTLTEKLPNVDGTEILPDGIGRGWLYIFSTPLNNTDGLQSPDGGGTGRVYILNESLATSGFPLVAGSQIPTYSKKTLTFTEAGAGPNGTDLVHSYKCYIPNWR